MPNKLVMALSVSLLSSACAYVTAVPAPPGAPVEGVRIYDVKPLLVVTGNQVTVLLVPNYNRAYALRFGSFLAKHDFTVEMQNGMISKIASNQDTTTVAIAIVNMITKAVETGNSIADAFSKKSDASVPGGRLQVFDIVFDDVGNIVSLRPLVADRQLLRTPATAAGGATMIPPALPNAGAGGAAAAGAGAATGGGAGKKKLETD